jgi:methylenetetrahydrofolate dehydrogenase (NADP+) / methenyltetrahydrofolate cyclohydrolase
MILLDGKAVSEKLLLEIKQEVKFITQNGKRAPHLAAVLVGNNPASMAYVGSKIKACEKVGFSSTLVELPADASEADVLNAVEYLNKDESVDGFIVQLPLPASVDEKKVVLKVLPQKDVDGFHPENLGRMMSGLPCFLPATPFGILKLMEHYSIETAGKNVVVLGRSNIVGTPISIMLSRPGKSGDATVTLCHSKTRALKEICLQADIIIAAIGRPYFLKADMVKKGAVVIDVGINRVEDSSLGKGYKLVGDADTESLKEVCSSITPVPGGVGPMTIAGLLLNTLQAYKNQNG